MQTTYDYKRYAILYVDDEEKSLKYFARAFEAFYTTKDVGKGTGLGLDIAQRIIVERHNGTITITSTPGETTLHVQIPIRQRPTP